MHILIDGYNLMYAAGLMRERFGEGGLERARRRMLGMLAGALGPQAERCTVVFDAALQPPAASQRQTERFMGIHVEYCVGEEADDRIEELIRRHGTPKQLMVVSSDRRLRQAAKRRGAVGMDSESFLAWLQRHRRRRRPGPEPEKPQKTSDREIDYWLHEFQDRVDERDLRELSGPFWDM